MSPATPPTTRRTEKYRDIAALGSGGMGDVFLSVARADGLGGFRKLLVIKRIRKSVADDPDVLKMFLNEARLAARLMHPNVVQTNEVGFDGQRHFIAMEYLDGQSLLTVLRRAKSTSQRFPLAMHLRVLSETLSGLHYAHDLADFDGTPLQIIHRDATPHNVFITYEGQVKIVDFGIAKVGQSGETRTGELKGKIPYMAPEQVTGAPIDRRCDVWAAGVMLWEALTRRRLWKASTEAQIVLGLGHGHISKAKDFAPDAPPALLAVVDRALAHRVDERYPTAGEMLADLEAAMNATGHQASAREVGKWVAEAFADDREQLRALIDRQIKDTQASPALARELPTIPPPHHSATSRVEETPSGRADGAMRPMPPPPLPPSGLDDLGALPPRNRARTPLLVVLFLLIAALGGGAALFVLPAKPSAPSTPAKSDPPKSTVSTAASEPSNVLAQAGTTTAAGKTAMHLTVKVEPESAKVLVDDVELPPSGDAFVLATAMDGLSHRVRVEAPGFATKRLWITFDRPTVELDVKLEKTGAPAGKPTAAGTKSTATAQPTGTAVPKSSIDTTAPF